MDTRVERWRRLAEGCELFTPARRGPFPLLLIIAGVEGADAVTAAWARTATARGWAALVVDSFGPRGWGPRARRLCIDSGLAFRGRRRAGDVLAAIEAARRMPVVDAGRLAMAGVGHGAWAVLELLAQPLTERGEVRIADACDADLGGVGGAFLVAPRLSRSMARTPWTRALALSLVTARGADARPVLKALAPALAGGCRLTLSSEPADLEAPRAEHERGLGLAAVGRLGDFLEGLQPSITTGQRKLLAI
jgi:hypothetical protein